MSRVIIVNGLGRCGTTMLFDRIRRTRKSRFRQPRFGFRVTFEDIPFDTAGTWKTHALPPAPGVVPAEARVIYLFGNPMDIAVSTHWKINSWGEQHHCNMGSDRFEPNNQVLREDSLDMAGHFAAWYAPQAFPLLTIRYESLWSPEAGAALDAFLGFELRLSTYRERERSWATHPEKETVEAAYGELAQTIDAADDVRLWDPT